MGNQARVGKVLMVQGCTSSAGKSYLTAAICRILANEGVRVAPFKAQNMSNNAGVTQTGLEMGRAQIVQAIAARVEPDVRMNPVLLKPEADTQSQVVVMGKADLKISRLPWRERREHLWPIVKTSLHSLLHEYEVVLIEGAGSPAEVNLRDSDIVNMAIALEAQRCGTHWIAVGNDQNAPAYRSGSMARSARRVGPMGIPTRARLNAAFTDL